MSNAGEDPPPVRVGNKNPALGVMCNQYLILLPTKTELEGMLVHLETLYMKDLEELQPDLEGFHYQLEDIETAVN